MLSLNLQFHFWNESCGPPSSRLLFLGRLPSHRCHNSSLRFRCSLLPNFSFSSVHCLARTTGITSAIAKISQDRAMHRQLLGNFFVPALSFLVAYVSFFRILPIFPPIQQTSLAGLWHINTGHKSVHGSHSLRGLVCCAISATS